MDGPGTTVGSLVIAAVGSVGTLLAIVNQYSLWVTLGGVAVIAVALIAAIWSSFGARHARASDAPPATSHFIKGDFSNSTMDTVESRADVFIDGHARGSRLRRIVHRPRGR